MKLLRVYLMVMGIILSLVIEFGILLPNLISASSTELFVIGIVIFIVSIPIYFVLGKSLYKGILSLLNN